MSKPKAPEYLRTTGKALWDDVLAKYALRVDELQVLASACRAADLEVEFNKAWRDLGAPNMSKGSMGQEVEHPLIGSADKQGKAKAQLLKQLNLPDDVASAPANQNRAAAQTSWAPGAARGRGA